MRWRTRSVAVCLGLAGLCLGQVSRAADDPRARADVDRVGRLFVSRSSIATVEMQITREEWQRTISMQLWSLGESKILVRIRRPPEDAGTAILIAGRTIWYYLPKANRTVKMPPAMMSTSLMGSDFTLSDLVKETRLSDDYAIATSFEGQRDRVAVTEYTLTPKPAAAVVWGKITLEIRRLDGMPVRQRYYDEGGRLVRELTFSGYRTVSGRLIPTRLVMQSAAKPDMSGGAAGGAFGQETMSRPGQAAEQTTITYENIVFDEPISEETFSLEKLKP